MSANDITAFIGRLPDKASAAYPIPTSLLKGIVDLVTSRLAVLLGAVLAFTRRRLLYPLDFKPLTLGHTDHR